MSGYSRIDPIIDKWVAALGTKLFTEWAGGPARFFYTSGTAPFDCFQISVDAPENERVSVHAKVIDANDDRNDELEQTWTGSIEEFDSMMSAAVRTIDTWKSQRHK
jgi:hypothetical protein